MGFNDKVNNSTSGGFVSSIFKPGVNFKIMAGGKDGAAIVFKLLPAYDKTAYVKDEQGVEYMDPLGYVPFRLEDGDLTDWGNLIEVAKFAGHGNRYTDGTRTDFVLLSNFDSGTDVYEPYNELRRYAASCPEWKYLVEDVKDGKGKRVENAGLPRPSRLLIANIIDMGTPDKVQVGLFSTSAYNSLCAPNGGLACQRAGNVTEEQIQGNYLCEWAVGDLTCPKVGPLLYCVRGTEKGEMSGYNVDLALDISKRVRRWAVNPPELLGYRYDIGDLSSILVDLNPEDIIKKFVALFNLRAPSGVHEYALLKEVFGSIYANIIPEPPASRGVSTGFGDSPAAGHKPTTEVKPTSRIKTAIARNAEPVQDGPPTDEPLSADVTPPAEQQLDPDTATIPADVPGVPVAGFDRQAFMRKYKKA